jgi:DNA-binding MarR family transcriptional regulator
MSTSARAVAAAELARCTNLRLRKLTRRVTQLYDRWLAGAGLTSTQFSLLAYLFAQEDLSIGELAELLVTDPTTLTRNLQPLEKQGYLRIVPGATDRRRRTVTLCGEGRTAFRRAVPLWRQAQARVAQALGERSLTVLNDSLDLALDRLAPK